jgi:hypothetical protein
VAIDQNSGIHSARRRTGNAVDSQPRLFEQAVEHAPRERAMGAATLQGEIYESCVTFGSFPNAGFCGSH